MKALRIIQTLFKIARVICIILFICGIIGAASCALTLLLVPAMSKIEVEGFNFAELMAENGLSMGLVYGSLAIAVLSCGTCIVLYKYTQKFCEKEIEIGTPFNMDVVKNMRKVALFHIIASLSLSLISGITLGIIAAVEGIEISNETNIIYTVGFGLSLLVLSLFCEAGISSDKKTPNTEEALEVFEEPIDVLSE